jgi:hypothetical protein
MKSQDLVRLAGLTSLLCALTAASACASNSGLAPKPSGTTASSSGAQETAPALAAQAQVTADCNHFRVRPVTIVIACGDGGFYLDHLRYDGWTRALANASGIAMARRCVPDCAHGHYVGQAVHVRLDRVRVVFGSSIFTRATITYTQSGRIETEFVLPLGCSVTPPHCPASRP